MKKSQYLSLNFQKKIKYYFNSSNGDVKICEADALYMQPVKDSWKLGYCLINNILTPDTNMIEPIHKESVPVDYRYRHISAITIINLLDHFFSNGDSNSDSNSDSDSDSNGDSNSDSNGNRNGNRR